MNETTNYPDINLALDGAMSVKEICINYINILNSTGRISDIVYANKLQEYLDVDEKIPLFEDEFHELRKFLRQWVAINNTNIFIKTRKKDFIGFNEKIRLYLQSQNPDKIHDLIGFRLILKTFETDSIESVKLCYDLLNDLIKFFVIKKKYEFLISEDLVDVVADSSLIPEGIIIPESNLILEGFENKVKDYIKSPKDDDDKYQSLHSCIRTPSGLIFEIQIRTFAMDIRTNHSSYKKKKYPTHIDLDYSKIALPGIAFDKNNELIFDNSGLLKSSDIFNNI